MIPNAVASTGPYAGLWSHLKSIDHTLERALKAGKTAAVSELDLDRLRALVDFLQGGFSNNVSDSQLHTSLLVHMDAYEPSYGTAIDLRQRLASVSEFQDWKRASKRSVESKIAGLIKAIEDFVASSRSGHLFTAVPVEEFRILRVIVGGLLADTETVLR